MFLYGLCSMKTAIFLVFSLDQLSLGVLLKVASVEDRDEKKSNFLQGISLSSLFLLSFTKF